MKTNKNERHEHHDSGTAEKPMNGVQLLRRIGKKKLHNQNWTSF
jgi:hypothetical protein